MKEIYIKGSDSSQRLDKYLRRLLRQATGGFLYKMLRKKNITLNGKKATGKEILKEDDCIRIYFSDETFAKLSAAKDETADLYKNLASLKQYPNIIFEDEELIIMNKPSGVLTQKADPKDVSLNEQMLSYLINEGGLSAEEFSEFKPSVMNRLDRQTSGIVIGAKTYRASREISSQIKAHELTKTYRCIVRGRCSLEGSYKAFWQKDRDNNLVRITDEPGEGKVPIETIFKTLEARDDLSLVEATLVTGKSHQIRAQLSHLGHPILFDPKYGDKEFNGRYRKLAHSGGQLLHAYCLTLKDGREFVCEEPDIFRQVMEEAVH